MWSFVQVMWKAQNMTRGIPYILMWKSIHTCGRSSSGHVADAGDMVAELAIELAGDVAPSWQVTWCRIIRGYHVTTSE
jgi:hypothetical protein